MSIGFAATTAAVVVGMASGTAEAAVGTPAAAGATAVVSGRTGAALLLAPVAGSAPDVALCCGHGDGGGSPGHTSGGNGHGVGHTTHGNGKGVGHHENDGQGPGPGPGPGPNTAGKNSSRAVAPPAPKGMSTVRCDPKKVCVIRLNGRDDRIKVSASGGKVRAYLAAALNSGGRPDCSGYSETSSDWMRFQFVKSSTGRTWSKTVVMTGRSPVSRAIAQKLLGKNRICFAAPYRFTVRDGYSLSRSGGNYLGVLPDCGSVPGGKPCVSSQRLVKSGRGYVVRTTLRVPASPHDPRARH